MDETIVIDIIAEQLGLATNQLGEKTIFTDMGADSLDLFQIISALEEEFEIEIENEDAEKIKTVGDAMGYIRNALEK